MHNETNAKNCSYSGGFWRGLLAVAAAIVR